MRVLQILRAPVGGLFRHVLDLSIGLSRRGCDAGIIADSTTGGARAEQALAEAAPLLRLGVTRLPMARNPGPGDLAALRAISKIIRDSRADIAHGHGSKGGLYARFPGFDRGGAAKAYTPHGGSLHYSGGLGGLIFGAAERLLMRSTDLFLFESRFAAERFAAQIAPPASMSRIIHNGLNPADFETVPENPDAAELLFIGELRLAKGIDTLIGALALIPGAPRLAIVGAGPDEAALRRLVEERGLSARIRFAGALPARQAFALGRVLAVPSRQESLPYIVLEAAAAGKPAVATNVGGIPEIFGKDASALVPPDDSEALAAALSLALAGGGAQEQLQARLRARIRENFSADAMCDGILAAYREAVERRPGTSRAN